MLCCFSVVMVMCMFFEFSYWNVTLPVHVRYQVRTISPATVASMVVAASSLPSVFLAAHLAHSLFYLFFGLVTSTTRADDDTPNGWRTGADIEEIIITVHTVYHRMKNQSHHGWFSHVTRAHKRTELRWSARVLCTTTVRPSVRQCMRA